MNLSVHTWMLNLNCFPSPKIAVSAICFMCIDAWIMADASSYVVFADITVSMSGGVGFLFLASTIFVWSGRYLFFRRCPVDPQRLWVGIGHNQSAELTCILLGWCAGILKSNTGVWINQRKAGPSAGVFCSSHGAELINKLIIKKITQSTCLIVKRRVVLSHDVSRSSSPARHRQLCSRTVTATSAKSKGKKIKVISN